VTNHVRLVSEVVVQDEESLLQVGLSLGDDFLVGGEETKDGVEPDGSGELKLLDREVDPRIDKAALEHVLAVKAVVSSQSSEVPGDGVALEDGTLRGFQDRDLTERALLLELGGHVVFAKTKVGDVELNSAVFRGDQALESSPVTQVGVQSQGRHDVKGSKEVC
jgi:hypothetical protein